MTVTITGSLKDVSGTPDNTIPLEVASVIRFAEDGSVITEKPVVVRQVGGRVRFELEPGYAEVRYGRKVWRVIAPDADSTLKALIEAAVAYPPDTPQALLDAAVGSYVEANREQFRTRAIPVTTGPDAGKAQWVDANNVAIGEPVPWDQVISDAVAALAAAAAAPAAVASDIAGRDVTVEDLGGGMARIAIGGVHAGPAFPLPGGTWSGLTGKPSVIGAGSSAAEARGLIEAAPDDYALVQLARTPEMLITGAISRDTNGAITTASVTWPDGTTGTFTATTLSTQFPGLIDAYTVTYGSPVTKTFTQAVVTRDASTGRITNLPAMAVS